MWYHYRCDEMAPSMFMLCVFLSIKSAAPSVCKVGMCLMLLFLSHLIGWCRQLVKVFVIGLVGQSLIPYCRFYPFWSVICHVSDESMWMILVLFAYHR